MKCYIFCDESRQSQHRYMILGGIIINSKYLATFNDTMKNFRVQYNMNSELKWTKVSRSKLEEYKKFIDHFFALNDTDYLHFHCLILDTHQINHKKYNNGNADLGFYKFYYQLLLHSFGRNYCAISSGKAESLVVCLDEKSSKYSLSELKRVLNNGINKKHGISTNPFKSVEPLDSKRSDVMQIADIIMGAIGYQKNGFHLLSNSSEAKKELANYIAKKVGVETLGNNSSYHVVRFKTWNFKFSK